MNNFKQIMLCWLMFFSWQLTTMERVTKKVTNDSDYTRIIYQKGMFIATCETNTNTQEKKYTLDNTAKCIQKLSLNYLNTKKLEERFTEFENEYIKQQKKIKKKIVEHETSTNTIYYKGIHVFIWSYNKKTKESSYYRQTIDQDGTYILPRSVTEIEQKFFEIIVKKYEEQENNN